MKNTENKQKILTDENLLEKDEHGSDDYRFSYYYTGFENIGYFCRKFKGLYNMTPGEYRNTAIKRSDS